MRSVIDISDLSKEEINELISTAEDIMNNPSAYSEKCRGKKIATLFFEPSTRTRLSFESAMYDLGGNVLSVTDSATSSVAKGESVADTARTAACFADIIAIRHPKEGAALAACEKADIPVINAGDGGHCHPTQTLTDLFTIYREKGRFENLTIGLCGDLKYGRTVHSLIKALSQYNNVKFVLISPEELKLPDYIKKEIIDSGNLKYFETSFLDTALPKLDILYMTRIQRERFDNKSEYERLKDSYILNAEKMKCAKNDCCVLHPLPRVNEIDIDFDGDVRACYFKQVLNGKFIRMALILKLLSEKNRVQNTDVYIKGMRCSNPRCITSAERGIEHKFIAGKSGSTYRCAYCESSEDKPFD